jgi:glycosyltransferase involved in cell wall biosynthesis
LELFRPDPTARGEVNGWQPKLGMGPLVVFTGTIGRANGLGYLVEVAVHMKSISPDVRFVVVGDGADRERVEEQASAAEILGTSMFFVGHVAKPVAAKWVCASDAIVCLFTGPQVVWKDAVQNKFFDALAAGKPTASNFEGFQSIVARDAEIGIIMDPASPSRGAQQLAAMLSDSEWRSGVAGRSAALAQHEFDRERLAGELGVVLARATTSSC